MKVSMEKAPASSICHFVVRERINGAPAGVTGDLTGVQGNLTGVIGDLTGVTGNLTRVYGDFDDCGITDEERKSGIDVNDLLDRSNGIGYLVGQTKMRFADCPFPRLYGDISADQSRI